MTSTREPTSAAERPGPDDGTVELDGVDLADPELHATDRVWEVFRLLRDRRPVHWNPERLEPGFWSVTRHGDCVRVLKDVGTFSSGHTNVLGLHRILGDQGAGRMLNTTDPPRHDELRRLVNRCFTPRAVAELERYLRAVVVDVLEGALERDRVDAVQAVSRIPVAAISALLGVPRDDWELLLSLTSTAFGSADAEFQLTPDARANAAQAHGRLLLYCRNLIDAKRSAGSEDIVATLARAEADGALSREESALFFDLLLLGGNETTRHALAGAILAFAQLPEQWRCLRRDPSGLHAAVEEVLRWTSPSRHVLRRAVRDVELHGETVRAGEEIVVWHVSANRDERVFADPDTFSVTRKPNPHIAFGSGAHYCLGGALATLELRVFLEELVRRVAHVELLAPPARLRSTVIGGIKHLAVRLHRA